MSWGESDPLTRARAFAGRFTERGRPLPPALKRALRVLEHAPASVRVRLAAALWMLYPELGATLFGPHEISLNALVRYSPLCPTYPAIQGKMAARLALGSKPTKVLPGLTAREAHEALRAGVTDPVLWLLRSGFLRSELLARTVGMGGDIGLRDVPTARWLMACVGDRKRWDALTREQTMRGPAGEEIRGRLLDRIDEISRVDLPRGEKTGVREAFESSARRAYERWCAEAEKQHKPLAPVPSWFKPIRCARLLMSAAELVAEGRELHHCVSTYAKYVKDRRSVIVSICVRARDGTHRSTAELNRATGSLLQHKGDSNRVPSELCRNALEVCLRRWGLEGKEQ